MCFTINEKGLDFLLGETKLIICKRMDFWTPRNSSSSVTLLSLARVLALKKQAWDKVGNLFKPVYIVYKFQFVSLVLNFFKTISNQIFRKFYSYFSLHIQN